MLGIGAADVKTGSIFDTIGHTRPDRPAVISWAREAAVQKAYRNDLKKACSLRIPVLGLVQFDQFIQLFLARLQRAEEIALPTVTLVHH